MTQRYVVRWRIAGTEYERTLAAAGQAQAIQRVMMDVAQSVVAIAETRPAQDRIAESMQRGDRCPHGAHWETCPQNHYPPRVDA